MWRWTWKPAHGIRLLRDQGSRRAWATDAMLADQLPLRECANGFRAVISGLARTRALRAWFAGAAFRMPGGTASPAIDPEVVGGEFSEGKEGISPKYMRSHGAGGNLRNGSNAGSAYLNCRNGLSHAWWSCLACNCLSISKKTCTVFRERKAIALHLQGSPAECRKFFL